ncbi:MAG: hypothetical protein C3F02_04430 [Parcubacteria group bacterium]|nr:MAG: hypothetical protein C3F02_04430 [Parcubacteria group bacterium]
MKKIMKPEDTLRVASVKSGRSAAWILLVVLFLSLGLMYILSNIRGTDEERPGPTDSTGTPGNKIFDYSQATEIAKFKSDADYKSYIDASQGVLNTGLGNFAVQDQVRTISEGVSMAPSAADNKVAAPDRVSTTNVQVADIDEPDIIKTDGQEIYYGGESNYYYPMIEMRASNMGSSAIAMPAVAPDIVAKEIAPYYNTAKTKLIRALPAESVKLESTIERSGNLLLADKSLLVFDNSQNSIYAYDVADTTKANEKWHLKLEDNTSLSASRLYDGKLYLITSTYINQYSPCPLKPLSLNDQSVTVPCSEIYHPRSIVLVDTNLSVWRLDPQTGEIETKTTFVANSQSSIVYMSDKSIYLTYAHEVDYIAMMLDFFQTDGKTMVPAEILAKLQKVNGYDLSQVGKMTEFQTLLENWRSSLNSDERLKLDNDLQNLLQKYVDNHKRDIVKTDITKISVPDLKLQASGLVPGTLLNQFSLDESQGYLRVATNVGGWFNAAIGGSNAQSANDVYVLNDKLKIQGSVLDLGLTEQIYSIRFIGDMAYLVTFRQTDPFYVLDLSNPKKPELKGQLKIPGYSSYLHPLSDKRLVGIGQESGKLKLSLFDVSNPADPREIDKYTLNEYGSESLYDHHAFLQDAKHRVFFVPGYNGAYVFSYTEDKLTLAHALDINQAKRALYINDNLYVIGAKSLFVLKESDWSKVSQLDLSENK